MSDRRLLAEHLVKEFAWSRTEIDDVEAAEDVLQAIEAAGYMIVKNDSDSRER